VSGRTTTEMSPAIAMVGAPPAINRKTAAIKALSVIGLIRKSAVVPVNIRRIGNQM